MPISLKIYSIALELSNGFGQVTALIVHPHFSAAPATFPMHETTSPLRFPALLIGIVDLKSVRDFGFEISPLISHPS